MTNRIMYVCTSCATESPETCGYYDREDLVVAPNGDWLCEGCAAAVLEDMGLRHAKLAPPPEYGPVAALKNLRFVRPHALATQAQIDDEVRPLAQHGDVRIVYVNEGDWIMVELAIAGRLI